MNTIIKIEGGRVVITLEPEGTIEQLVIREMRDLAVERLHGTLRVGGALPEEPELPARPLEPAP